MNQSICEVNKDALWRSIESFPIGGEPAVWNPDTYQGGLSFSQRLARENGWSLAHARACIDEYRRFLFLAARAGHPVTPSDVVDQVWHQHLVYTENYWIDLCGDVLPTPLHHGPTRGGVKERAHFQDQYERTLGAYQRFFGEPPRDIWPTTQERFAQSIASVRVDRRKVWILPKPRFSWTLPSHGRLAIGGVVLLPFATVFPFNLDGPTFLAVYGLILALAIVFCWISYCVNNGFFTAHDSYSSDAPSVTGDSLTGSSLDWSSLAMLVGGKQRLLQTAMIELARRKLVRCNGNSFELVDDAIYRPSQQDSEAAIATYQAIVQALKQSNKAQTLKRLKIAIHSTAVRIEMQLQANGYVRESDQKMFYRGVVMTVAMGTLSIGALRGYQGVMNDRPIGFLVVEMLIGAFLFAYVFRLDGKLTAKGHAAVERSRLAHKPSGLRALQANQIANGVALPYLAVLGPAAITAITVDSTDVVLHNVLFGEEIRALQNSRAASISNGFEWDSSSSASFDSSSSSFDGGGDAGCGGGCGGCGG